MHLNRESNILKHILIIFLLIGFLFADYKSINDDILINNDKIEIVRIILSADGYIDENLYNIFWKNLRKTTTSKQIEDLKKYFKLNIKDIQVTIWKCVKNSIQNNRVCKSKKLDRILLKMREDKLFIAYNNTIELLMAAAEGKLFSLNGKDVIITEELVNHILNNLDSSLKRLQILFSDKWISK